MFPTSEATAIIWGVTDLNFGNVIVFYDLFGSQTLGFPEAGGNRRTLRSQADFSPNAHSDQIRRKEPRALAAMQARQSVHNQAVATSFVQFDVLDRILRAAENASTRHVVLGELIRTVHNLVRGRYNTTPSWISSHWTAKESRQTIQTVCIFCRPMENMSGMARKRVRRLFFLLLRTLRTFWA